MSPVKRYIYVYVIRTDHKISVHSVRRVGSLCPAYTLLCSQPFFFYMQRGIVSSMAYSDFVPYG